LEAGEQIILLANCRLQFIKKLRFVGSQGEGACCAGDA